LGVSSAEARAAREILEIELGARAAARFWKPPKGQFLFRVTMPGRNFLLQEGTDQRYGARHLKRSIERACVIDCN